MTTPSTTQDPVPVRHLAVGTDDILGFSIANEPTKADYLFINNLITAQLKKESQLRMLLRFSGLSNELTESFFNELRETIDFFKRRTRIAVCCDHYQKQRMNLGELVSEDIAVGHFGTDQQAAIEWLSADF